MENAFNERGVVLNRNGLNAGGQTFLLREIQNCRIVTVPKNKVVPLSISAVGAMGAIGGGMLTSGAGLTLGIMLMVVGLLSWLTQDVTHRLMISTAHGESEALSSPDLEFTQRVQTALQHTLNTP